jgi:hypothetical protein
LYLRFVMAIILLYSEFSLFAPEKIKPLGARGLFLAVPPAENLPGYKYGSSWGANSCSQQRGETGF